MNFQKTYGFAPTSKRISLKRTENLRKWDLHVWKELNCSYGPIGRNVEDLKLIMSQLYGNFSKLDCDISPLKWNEVKFK